MQNFKAKVTTRKDTKKPMSRSDQRTAVPKSNKSNAIEIESENLPKELVATTNQTIPIATPNTPAQDKVTETINTENEILLGLYPKCTIGQTITNNIKEEI